MLEEDVKRISSFVFTREGKSIVMSNKSRILNAEQQHQALNQNILSLKNELRDLNTHHDQGHEALQIQITALQLRVDNPNSITAFEGWNESRMTELEDQVQELQNQLTELRKPIANCRSSNNNTNHHSSSNDNNNTHINNSRDNSNRNNTNNSSNNNAEKTSKTRTVPSYKNVIVRRDALLLTDSNGKGISAKKIKHEGGVQRHTCYTLRDISNFVSEVAVEKQPSKIYLQVGTNDLTQHQDVEKLLLDLGNTISVLKEKFPCCRVYVSNLLPRKDNINTLVRLFNKMLDDICDKVVGVRIVSHLNIDRSDLYDNLHLHEAAFFDKYLWNIKQEVFGIPPPRWY